MTKTAQLLARRSRVVPRGIPQVSSFAVERASGAMLIDVEGREILDLATGIGVMSAGHCDPTVVEAIAAQAGKLQHTCIHVATYQPYVELCEVLCERFPHRGDTMAFLLNSGAEAVENCIKIARQATGRPAVLCFTEGFHGRTLLGMSLTSKVAYKTGCGPFAPEIYRLPYPNYYKFGDGLSHPDFVARELRRLREALISMVAAQDVAAILIEVVQGEGGVVPCPPDYLRGLREICDEHGILLICDEVQSGFCRTGAWASYEHAGIEPDLSSWAKAMGGGLPISAVIGSAEAMNKAAPGTIGGTYGGNPVACASALATIRIMEERDLCGRARAIGDEVTRRLGPWVHKLDYVGELRGMGAMMALEMVEDGDPQRPAAHIAKRIVSRCHELGLLVLTAGPMGNVVRLLPPLTISDDELGRALTVLEDAISSAD